MNSRLDLFNKQLEASGIDVQVNTIHCKVLIKDIPNQGLKETKYVYIPLGINVSIGDTITFEDKKYMVLNIKLTNCYSACVVEEVYHCIKIKYSWLNLMQFDCIVDVKTQTMIDTAYLLAEKTLIEIQLQRNELSKQIKNGTRFFVFDIPYKITSITYENNSIFTFKCEVDGINPKDDKVNQIADNSQLNPPKPPIVEYTIVSSASANGTISPLGEVKVQEGNSQVFSIIPNEGYELDTVLVDGEIVGDVDSNYTFENVSANHTISVTFKEKQVAEKLTIVEQEGYEDLAKGYPNTYYLRDTTGENKTSVTWSVDKSWIELTQDGTKCEIEFNELKYVGETVVLKAEYKGNAYTLNVICTNF